MLRALKATQWTSLSEEGAFWRRERVPLTPDGITEATAEEVKAAGTASHSEPAPGGGAVGRVDVPPAVVVGFRAEPPETGAVGK